MTFAPLPLTTIADDPLVTAAERIPLAWPRSGRPTASESVPSPAGVRPFGLRFAVEVPAKTVSVPGSMPAWRYCPDRQIAVGDNGQPWRSLVDMTMSSTGPSPDGSGNTGNEEWRPDFMSDETG